ncbi:HupA family protein [Paracoccus liaowanqingii]
MMKFFACGIAVSMLGACGGGGGGGFALPGGGGGTPGSYNALAVRGAPILQELKNIEYTTNAQMPTDGTATYRGVAAYGDGNVLSSAQLQANFDNSTMTGRLHNFHAEDGTGVSGDIAIRNGEIRDTGYSAELAGNITTESERAIVSGTVNGDFSGRNAQIVDGVIAAQLQAPSGVDFIGGEMVLKR